ncbi:Arc family DNA-binding protein [Psychrobacter sp.]|uniref:Arc family DNA-binding protein n=1 Tax=Psychrobacter sp. TaxID=56811 RepID=UPI003BAF8660
MAVVQFNLRVPEELKKQVNEAAQISGRSINAEAAYRLEQSFAKDHIYPPGYIPGYDNGIRLELDSEWFEKTGLTADEFAHYVRLSMLNGLSGDKGSK